MQAWKKGNDINTLGVWLSEDGTREVVTLLSAIVSNNSFIALLLLYLTAFSGSSFSIAARLRTGRRGFVFSREQGLCPPRHRIHDGSVARPANYTVGTGHNVARTWSWPLTSIWM